MNHTSTLRSTGGSQAPRSRPRDRKRLFYIGTACVMLIAVLIGFRHFFLQGAAHPGRELTPKIRSLIIVHGISMTGWVILFLVQSFLIAARRHRLHMRLGWFAVVLAALILVSGFWFNLASFRLAPPDFVLWTLTMKQFMVLGFYTLLMFAAFVGVGVLYRRRPEIHRPMMLLATLSTMTPAIARIDALNAVYQGTVLERIFGPSLGMLVLGAAFCLMKWCIGRTVDRWYAIGYCVLAATQLLTIQFARTRAWDQFASFLLR
jgi:hypothetical protein